MFKIFNRLTEYLKPAPIVRYVFRKQTAGETVNQETALTYSAVWRAVNLISESIACLPWQVKQREIRADGRTITRRLLTHPAAGLLDLQSNRETDAFQFRQTLIAHALTWGNGLAEIERDRSNRPVALWIIEPHRFQDIERDEQNELYYKIYNGDREPSFIHQNNMFHLKGLGFDGLRGYSVVSYAARSIGMGLATEQFGADFFSNGAHAGGVLQHPKGLSDTAHGRLKESMKEAVSGRNKHEPLILEEGMTWESITIPPDDAQFLETRRFNVSEIARWFGVPPHKLMEMEKSTFNNIEQQNIEFVSDSLLSWVKRLELEANIKLVSPGQRMRVFSKINMRGLLRGDTAARGEWYTRLNTMGVYSVNDIRELEDENPIGAEGDKHLVQLNLTTLENVGNENNNETDSNAQIETEMDEPAGGQDNPAAQNTFLVNALNKIFSREQQRFDEALENKKQDKDFYNWLDKFLIDQNKYTRNKLSDFNAGTDKPINEDILNLLIHNYIDDIKQRAQSSYEAGEHVINRFTLLKLLEV